MNANEKLINSEMLISRCFIASAQNMFGESYKAIIRNIPRKYGTDIVDHLMENVETDFIDDKEKLKFLFQSAISADFVDVEINDDTVLLTTKNCSHHKAVAIEKIFGLDKLRVCVVGIIGTCLIGNVLGSQVEGGKKDPGKYDETGICTIRFNLFKPK
jgi:hypothetical protein